MDLSSLRAPRPVPPKLSSGDARVQGFLRDLEKIKTTQRHRKKLKRCETLIYRVVQSLRKTKTDHLLYTTAVWTLVQIFRLFPETMKEVMLAAGVPALLYEVLHSGLLSGSMRQYTSELCFFLSSNHPYPMQQDIPVTGPLKELPNVAAINRYNENLDEISLPSDYSDVSSLMHDHKNHDYPFVPYRIDSENMRKIDALFNEGYEKELADTLPNPNFMSGFGFSATDPRVDHMDTESSSDSDKEVSDDDDQSLNSTISSGSRATSQNSHTVMTTSTTTAPSRASRGSSNQSFEASRVAPLQGSLRASQLRRGSKGLKAPGQGEVGLGFSTRPATSTGMLSSYESTTVTDPNFYTSKESSYALQQQKGSMQSDSYDEALKATLKRPMRFAALQPDEAVNTLSPVLNNYRPSTTSSQRAKTSLFRIGGPAISFDADAPSSAVQGAQSGRPHGGRAFDSVGDEFGLSRTTPGGGPRRSGMGAGAGVGVRLGSYGLPYPGTQQDVDFYGVDTLSSVPMRVNHEDYQFSKHLHVPPPVHQGHHHHHQGNHHHHHHHSQHSHAHHHGFASDHPNRISSATATFMHSGAGAEAGAAGAIGLGLGGPQQRSLAPLQPMASITGGFNYSTTLQSTLSRARTTSGRSAGRALPAQGLTATAPSQLPGFTRNIFPHSGSSGHHFSPHHKHGAGAGAGSMSADLTGNINVDSGGGKLGSEIADMLAQLDPLSLNVSVGMRSAAEEVERKHKKRQKRRMRLMLGDDHNAHASDDGSQGSWVSDALNGGGTSAGGTGMDRGVNLHDDVDDDDDDDDDDMSDNGLRGTITSYIAEGPDAKTNKFILRKRQRIRAEKLVDHTFAKRIFAKNATTAQAQNLISRMESVLQLMDPKLTGFVTWECFTRMLVAVAPSHLLRADVMEFMNAQTDDVANLIDYNEFIISGKVMIIRKNEDEESHMPIGGWLNRQKLFTGEQSTYTWKNHVKWFQTRKAKAVVWLMRRAARSLKHTVVLAEAEKYLLRQRRRALAATFLLEVGHVAKSSQDNWVKAKRNLLTRCMHARRWSTKVDSAAAFLQNKARVELDLWAERVRAEEDADNIDEALRKAREEEMRNNAKPKKQADYATFYKRFQYTNMAVVWLKQCAQKALDHCMRQDDMQEELAEIAKASLMQMLFVEEARRWLLLTGEHAYNYCIMRDEVMKFLFRTGQHALKYLIRQEDALVWLSEKGRKSKKFMGSKMTVRDQLLMLGKKTLAHMNDQEDAFAFLVAKRARAARLLERRAEAVPFLRRQPYGIWDQQDKRVALQETLAEIGAKAVVHCARQHKAFVSLQHTAGRARVAQRNSNIAFADLIQFGQNAKVQRFAQLCRVMPSYAQRVREELRRVTTAANKEQKARDKLPKVSRWRVELEEAFDWVALSVTPPAFHGEKRRVIGRVGFQRLLMDGKLLGISHQNVYEYFKSVDPSSACYVNFDMVWAWFLHQAQVYEQSLPKGKRPFTFTAAQIISHERRAQVTVMKRINAEKIDMDSDLDWEALKRGKKGDGSDSEEESDSEFDEFEGMDEDTLFSNLDFLRRVDVGRLMRYLTKKKMQREQAAALERRMLAAMVAAQQGGGGGEGGGEGGGKGDGEVAGGAAADDTPSSAAAGATSGTAGTGVEGVTGNETVASSAVSTAADHPPAKSVDVD